MRTSKINRIFIFLAVSLLYSFSAFGFSCVNLLDQPTVRAELTISGVKINMRRALQKHPAISLHTEPSVRNAFLAATALGVSSDLAFKRVKTDAYRYRDQYERFKGAKHEAFLMAVALLGHDPRIVVKRIEDAARVAPQGRLGAEASFYIAAAIGVNPQAALRFVVNTDLPTNYTGNDYFHTVMIGLALGYTNSQITSLLKDALREQGDVPPVMLRGYYFGALLLNALNP